MIAPPASLIDQMYRPMEGRGLDGLGGQFASIPGGPGAEQLPQAILDQGIHNRTGIEAGIAGMIPAMQQQNLQGGPKALEGPTNIQPEFDQYGQPRMHTPGMQQVQVPNPNYGIDPATNKTPNQYLPGIGYINVTGNAETTLPGQLETVVRPGGLQPYVRPLPDFYKGFGEDDKTGIMYNDTFYRAADPRRTTMDFSPLDGLIASDPEFANRFRAGEFDFVKDPGDNAMQRPLVNGGAKLPMRPDGSIMQPLPVQGDGIRDLLPAGPMPNTPGVDYDAQANPFGPQEGVMPELDNIGLITNAPGYNPVTPQQPTGGFDSKAFANELLTGIGDLFKQHFPESAQMAFNNSNQMQSQIEQPIQDATTFDVQPQQNMAFNPFSVNTLGGSFGGGY